MFLLIRKDEETGEDKPIGIFDRIETITAQVEQRIMIDYLTFKGTTLFNLEQFPLNIYLDMKILIVERDVIAWVIPDFIFNEVAVYEVLNAENSNIINTINKYNDDLVYG